MFHIAPIDVSANDCLDLLVGIVNHRINHTSLWYNDNVSINDASIMRKMVVHVFLGLSDSELSL